jgi:membrane protein YqaA with SNARE-associated domain
MDYIILFLAAFGAATILPFYSEVVMLGLVTTQPDAWIWFWAVASVGNTLGALVNWWIGQYLLHYRDSKWFPFKGRSLETAQRWFNKYGVWSLLFAWAPVGGDAITFIAGMMRVRVVTFLILTFIGKSLRYLIVAAAAIGLDLQQYFI